jgi:hypothetical protein
MGERCGTALFIGADRTERNLVVELLSRAGFECATATSRGPTSSA